MKSKRLTMKIWTLGAIGVVVIGLGMLLPGEVVASDPFPCSGGVWTSSGCSIKENSGFWYDQECVYIPNENCYQCIYSCEVGPVSMCTESNDGGAKDCMDFTPENQW